MLTNFSTNDHKVISFYQALGPCTALNMTRVLDLMYSLTIESEMQQMYSTTYLIIHPVPRRERQSPPKTEQILCWTFYKIETITMLM